MCAPPSKTRTAESGLQQPPAWPYSKATAPRLLRPPLKVKRRREEAQTNDAETPKRADAATQNQRLAMKQRYSNAVAQEPRDAKQRQQQARPRVPASPRPRVQTRQSPATKRVVKPCAMCRRCLLLGRGGAGWEP